MPPNEHVQEEREVTFMESPSAQFVSLVDRGANQTPWLVVKKQKEAVMPQKFIVKLMAPKDADLEAIKSALGDAGEGLTLEGGTQRGELVVFDQMPLESMKADSLQMVTLDKELGLKALAAEPVDKKEGFFGILKSQKMEGVELQGEFDALEDEALKAQYSESLYGELYAFSEGVQSIMAQEKGDPGKKLAAIKTMTGALMDHISEALSVVKEEALEMAAPTASKEDEKVEEEVDKSEDAEVPEVEADEKVEEGVEIEKSDEPADEPDTASLVDAKITELKASLKTELTDDLGEAFKEALADVVKSVEGISDSVAKMQKRVPSAVEDRSEDDIQATEKSQADDSSFKGVLFGRP